MKITANHILAGLALLAAGAVALAVKKNGAAGAGAAVGRAAVDAVDGVATGVVTGIGRLVGVPETSESECAKAMREGRTWDASFACPAGTFLKYVVTPSEDPAFADPYDRKLKNYAKPTSVGGPQIQAPTDFTDVVSNAGGINFNHF